MQKKIHIDHLGALHAIAVQLAGELRAGDIVFLHGELGAGKTTLTQMLLKALRFTGTVKSPTYTFVETYVLQDFTLYHFDLYRLTDPDELFAMGIDDYHQQDAVWIVEWPEKAGGYLPNATLSCTINILTDDERELVIERHEKT